MTFPQRDSIPFVWQQQQQQQQQQSNITYIISAYCKDLFIMPAQENIRAIRFGTQFLPSQTPKLKAVDPYPAVQEILVSLQLNGTLPWSEITPPDPIIIIIIIIIIIEMYSICTSTNYFSKVFHLLVTL